MVEKMNTILVYRGGLDMLSTTVGRIALNFLLDKETYKVTLEYLSTLQDIGVLQAVLYSSILVICITAVAAFITFNYE